MKYVLFVFLSTDADSDSDSNPSFFFFYFFIVFFFVGVQMMWIMLGHTSRTLYPAPTSESVVYFFASGTSNRYGFCTNASVMPVAREKLIAKLIDHARPFEMVRMGCPPTARKHDDSRASDKFYIRRGGLVRQRLPKRDRSIEPGCYRK
jgi:apolipoprotein N-acyltransferase